MMVDPISDQSSDLEKNEGPFEPIRLSHDTANHNQGNSITQAAIPSTSTSSARVDKVERFWQSLTNFPENLIVLKQTNPRLADAFLSGNTDKFAQVLNLPKAEQLEQERERIQLLNMDRLDPEEPCILTEEICTSIVNSNLETAMQYHPETFKIENMLFVNCKINGHSERAAIDTASETTVMKKTCAERCGIIPLIDERFSGSVRGTAVQNILGRVHFSHIQINDIFLQSSFIVLEELAVDLIIGLDILIPHQCCIDLKRNVLVIGSTDTIVPFLSEKSLTKISTNSTHFYSSIQNQSPPISTNEYCSIL